MKHSVFAVVLLVLALSGCLPVTSTPAPRFYMLHALERSQVSKKFDIAAGTVIVVGPVKIPKYMDRPQIVTRNRDNTLKFAQFDRWGEALDQALARMIAEDLSLMMPQAVCEMFPANYAIPYKYQVIVDVVHLTNRLNEDLAFVTQWSVLDSCANKMLLSKRSEFRMRIAPQNYFGLTDALSQGCASLSSEIAEALAGLSAAAEPGKAIGG